MVTVSGIPNTATEIVLTYSSNTTGNLAFGGVAITGVQSSSCEHVWDEGEVTTQATCLTEGVMTYTCTLCGETMTEAIPMTGHEDENEDYVCDLCGKPVYKIAGVPTNGDKIVLFNPGSGIAMSDTANNGHFTGITVNNQNGILGFDPDAAAKPLVLTMAAADDTYFYLKSGNLYLTAGPTGDSLTLAAKSDLGLWYLTDFGDNVASVINKTAAYDSDPVALEAYNGYFTSYGYEGAGGNFAMSFYTIPGEPEHDCVDVYVIDKTSDNQQELHIWAWGKEGNIVGNWDDRPSFTHEGDNAISDKEHDYASAHHYYKFKLDVTDYGTGFLITTPNGQTGNLALTDQHKADGIAVFYLYNNNGIAASAGDTEIWKLDSHTQATCNAAETYHYVGILNNGSYDRTVGEPLNHAWGNLTYTWSADHSTCTAQVVCGNNELHKITETAVAESEEGEEGVTYTAEFPTDRYPFAPQEVFVPFPDFGDMYFEKVTSTDDLIDGDYLIVYEDDSLAFNGSLATLDATGNSIAVALDTTLNKIQANENSVAAVFTIDVAAGSIKSASGLYIGGAATDANGMRTSETSDFINTISIEEDGSAAIVAESGTHLRYNKTSGQERFRYFKSSTYTSQQPVALYKLVDNTPPAHEHHAVQVEAVAATCTVDGRLGYYYCSAEGCPEEGKYFADEELMQELETIDVPALGHTYASVITPPTCTEDGYTTYTCSACGHSYVAEETEATGHEWGEWQVTTPASCTGAGLNTRYCANCNASETQEVPATNHTEAAPVQENLQAPTCTEAGSHDEVVYCSVCNIELSRETVVDAALGHDYEYEYIDNDQHKVTCSRCDYNETKPCEYGSDGKCTKCGHERAARLIDVYIVDKCSFDNVHAWIFGPGNVNYDDPNPVFPGNALVSVGVDFEGKPYYLIEGLNIDVYQGMVLTYVVNDDQRVQSGNLDLLNDAGENNYIVYNIVEISSGALNVNNIDDIWLGEGVYTDPTCTEAGYTTYNGKFTEHKQTVPGAPALGHDFSIVLEENPATCTEAGSRVLECSRCDETTTEVIPATGHTWGDWVDTTPATCTEDGVKTRECSVCHETETEAIEALGHNYVGVVTEPTCVDRGYTTYTCSRCGDSYVDDYVDANGHDWGDWNITTVPTCTEAGMKTRTCFVCSETETEAIPATGHTAGEPVNEKETQAEFGVEGGYDKVVYCSVCDAELSRDHVRLLFNGYYLIRPNWNIDSVNAGDIFGANPDNANQYLLHTELSEGQQIKVVKVENTEIIGWYPEGMDNQYTVDAEHAGEVNIYFNPNGEYDWSILNGFVWIGSAHVHTPELVDEVPATCTQPGVAAYYRCSDPNCEYYTKFFTDDTLTVELTETVIPALGHNWGEPVWTWNEDHTAATATFTCQNDSDHVETVNTTEITSVKTPATQEAEGSIVYTATVTFENETYTGTDTVVIPKLPTATVTEEEALENQPVSLITDLFTPVMTVDEIASVYAFKADEPTEAQTTYYGGWRCDYRVTFNDVLAANSFGLHGAYDGFGTSYSVSFLYPTDTTAGEEVYLLTAAGLDGITYNDVLAIDTFTCGVFNLAAENVGKTMKVELVIWDPADENVKYVIAEQNYSFVEETKAHCITHTWGEITYEWADDYSSCTATRSCPVCGDVETETINTTSEVTKPATCEAMGETTYTATFTNEAFAAQTKTVENIDAIGHNWGEPTYEWADDYSSCTATRVCANDETHVETETVNTTSEVTKPATCEAMGETTYTATFTNEAFAAQTKTVENVDALGHNWGEPTYEWADDYSSCTATRVCANDETHVETETVNTTSEVTKPATCEAMGETTYTATFTNEAFAAQTKTVENVDALGHNWGEPTYEWADDYSSCTATRVCANDETHVETETVNTTSEVTKPATCEAMGETTYTATFTNEAFAAQTKTVENIDAIGHNWGEPEWTWNEDHTVATATFTCQNDSAHVQEVATENITSVTTPPTQEADGRIVYTATVEFDGKTYTDTDTVVIPKLPTEITLYSDITLGIDLHANYKVRQSDVADLDHWYIEVTRTKADGTVDTKRFSFDDGNIGSINRVPMYLAVYSDIPAKAMSDHFVATFHGFDSENNEIVTSNTVQYSLRDYLLDELMKVDNGDAMRTLAANLLNYGAAAQIYFDYDAENLVNENLSAEQQTAMNDFATSGEARATLENSQVGPNIYNSVSILNRIVLDLTVRNMDTPNHVQIQIKNHDTGEVKGVVEMNKVVYNNRTLWKAKYSGFGAKDMRTVFDFTVLADGQEAGTPITWSVEGYVRESRLNEDSTEAERNLFNALLHYVDAVDAAFPNS